MRVEKAEAFFFITVNFDNKNEKVLQERKFNKF